MGKAFLQNILEQNKMTGSFSFNSVSNENAGFRLNKQAASIGSIYRHIGETMNLFTTFFGLTTDVQDTTMGRTDTGQGKNVEESRDLIKKGYSALEQIIERTPEEDWLAMIDTPFFWESNPVKTFFSYSFS
jgi:hypothetical protein